MAKLNILQYFHGNSLIHKIDPRIKLVCFLIFTIAITNGGWSGYLFLTLLIFSLFFYIKLPLIVLIKELRYFSVFILFVVIMRSFNLKGQPLLAAWSNGPTFEGLLSGLLFAWKIGLIVFFSLLFTRTTRISDVNKAIQYFLKPVPFIPEVRLATLISLVISLFPLIFEQANEIKAAQKARCIENIKNPIKRIKLSVLPLVIKTLHRADDIAYAMESRCYCEESRSFTFQSNRSDWLVLTATILCLAFVLTLKLS